MRALLTVVVAAAVLALVLGGPGGVPAFAQGKGSWIKFLFPPQVAQPSPCAVEPAASPAAP
jgi:hypothetical protein